MTDPKPKETPTLPPTDMTRAQLVQSVTVNRRRAKIRWITSAVIFVIVLVIAFVHRGHG